MFLVRGLAAAALVVTTAAAGTEPRTGASRLVEQEASVLLFGAASLRTAIDEIAPLCRRTTGVDLRASYAATSALARQLEAGAPADIFISADLEWMDYAGERRLIDAASRFNLLGNGLVLVAPKASTVTVTIAPGMNLSAALGDGRLAVADPAAVPAGRYARAALESLGVWTSVAARLAPAENVRAALLLVSRGEAPLGIVYRTDAAADAGVRIVATFPASTHPPIVYPAALTPGAKPAARAMLACLRSSEAWAVFDRWGFTRPPDHAR